MAPAEAPLLADGDHHLPQQVHVGNVFSLAAVAGAFDDLPAEALDLVYGHAAEVIVQRLSGFELRTIDQQRARAGNRITVFVEVAE